MTIKNGWRSCITFSRGNPTSQSQLFRIGSKWDIYEHAVESRLLDNHGLVGNIGYTHNVEYLVDVAECLKGDKYVMFCIIGEGMKKAAIMQKVKT